MKPCYALLSEGSYVALHGLLGFGVDTKEAGSAFVLGLVSPEAIGKQWDNILLYTWSAYPHASHRGQGESENEAAANEMLNRIMLHLASDQGGILVMDDIAAQVVKDLGLEDAPAIDPHKEALV